MHTFTEEKFKQDVDPILRRVFVGNEYSEPFVPKIEERLLLYFPVGGNLKRNIDWEIKLFEAICRAIKLIGDTGCYMAAAWEFSASEFPENRYAYIPASEFREAFIEAFDTGGVWERLDIIENFGYCLCSANGNWGLLKTIDEHAFLGGNSNFMQAVKNYFPEIEQEVLEFLHDLRLEHIGGEKINMKWLKQTLTHVYGSVLTEQMMINSELT